MTQLSYVMKAYARAQLLARESDPENPQCRICRISQQDHGKQLAVDHCHQTGSLRGLLCTSCNVGLGMFKDNPAALIAAADYLLGHPVVTTPSLPSPAPLKQPERETRTFYCKVCQQDTPRTGVGFLCTHKAPLPTKKTATYRAAGMVFQVPTPHTPTG